MSQKSSKRGNTGELSLEEAYRKAYESIAEVMENSRRFADWKEHERALTPTQLELAERIRTAFAGITCGESLGYMSGEAADGPCTEKYLRLFMQREERRD